MDPKQIPLRDLHLPEGIGWWPLAPGWWVVIALVMIGGFREILGYGSFLGIPLFGPNFEPWIVMILPAGGFFALGFTLLGFGWWESRKQEPVRPRSWPHSVTTEVVEAGGAD